MRWIGSGAAVVVLVLSAGGCAKAKQDGGAEGAGGAATTRASKYPLERSVTDITPPRHKPARQAPLPDVSLVSATPATPAYAMAGYGTAGYGGTSYGTPMYGGPAYTPAAMPASSRPQFVPADVPPQPVADFGGAASQPPVSSLPAPARHIAQAGGRSYVVQKGDTLFRIAHTHYGNGNQWARIASANPGLSPATLQAGATIVVP